MQYTYSTLHKTCEPLQVALPGFASMTTHSGFALFPHCGEQCFAKYSFIAEYMDSGPQGIKYFSFIVMCFLQFVTQSSNSSWWAPLFTKYSKASEQLEYTIADIHIYVLQWISSYTTLLLQLAKRSMHVPNLQ